MREAELDMEVTPERVERMKQTLLRLWADQNGVDFKTMEVTIEKVSCGPA